ncbi:MAG: hypothetical protein BGN88_08335 [Clostridiales bacterium 43-6]|nr:MAG: hypothetical protein BGN88_08335 [Clostridiales bacterium 43-6]
MKRALFLLVIFVLFLSGCSSTSQKVKGLPIKATKVGDNANGTVPEDASVYTTADPSDTVICTYPPDTTNPNSEKITADSKGIIEIKEKMFIAQCNDIYMNPGEYKGKTVKLEGFCDRYTDPDTKKTGYYVIRNGPGCCGNDGVAGFEFTFAGTYPEKDEWLEVIGTIELITVDDYTTVLIKADSVKVLTKRGAEFVQN